jgi:hypothetical protein
MIHFPKKFIGMLFGRFASSKIKSFHIANFFYDYQLQVFSAKFSIMFQ